jgi:alcohol dehydrogenase class IV
MGDDAVYQPNGVRVAFGSGAVAALAAEADRLAITRSVILCSPGRTAVAESLARILGRDAAVICDAARPNFPESAFDAANQAIRDAGANGFVVVGGGTPIGLGKAVGAATRLPYVAVPTTYSGSELASNWYVGRAENKRQGNDAHALPATIIYDPELTLGLSPPTTAASGMNAMAHAVESLYGADLNPVVALMAAEAVRLLGDSLPRCVDRPDDLAARGEALKGAWFAAGFRAGRGLSHAMAQQIRYAFDLDHARTHAVSLPYAVAFNAPAARAAMEAIGKTLDAKDAARGLYDLNRRLGLATGYRDLGMPRDGIERAVELVAAATITHPRPAGADQVRRVVEAAWAGDPPTDF